MTGLDSTEPVPGLAPFGLRLRAAMQDRGPLCVGIDPHPGLLAAWGLADDPAGLETFAMTVVEALAITATPYLGFESLRPLLDTARAGGFGVFVVTLTSNPEGPEVQLAAGKGGRSVAARIAEQLAMENAGAVSSGSLGSVGAVVGATVGETTGTVGAELFGGDAGLALNGPILAPGLGAQGATPADLRKVFGTAICNVLPAASRSVLGAGPDVAELRAAAERALID